MNRVIFCAVFVFIPMCLCAEFTYAQKKHSIKEKANLRIKSKSKEVITLPQAISRAINASPRLRTADAVIHEARALKYQKGRYINPQFNFQLQDFSGNKQYKKLDSAEVSYFFTQQLDLTGKRTKRVDAATQMVMMKQFEKDIMTKSLKRDVREAYTNAVRAHELLALVNERTQLARRLQRAVQHRVHAAREPEVQLIKAKINVANTMLEHSRAKREMHHTKHILSSLWARHDDNFHIATNYFYAIQPPPSELTVVRKIRRTPEMKVWEATYRFNQHDFETEQAKWFPDPQLSFGYRDLRADNAHGLYLAAQIDLPLFDKNIGNARAARSRMVKAQHDKANDFLQIRNLAYDWLEQSQNAYDETIKLKREIIPQAYKAARLARQMYEKGKYPYLEVIDAQQTLFQAKTRYIESLSRYHIASANLKKIMES